MKTALGNDLADAASVPKISLVCVCGFAFLLASEVARNHGADSNSQGPYEQHDRYLEPVAGGVIEGLNEGKGRDDQENRTHRCLFQHRFYVVPFPYHARKYDVKDTSNARGCLDPASPSGRQASQHVLASSGEVSRLEEDDNGYGQHDLRFPYDCVYVSYHGRRGEKEIEAGVEQGGCRDASSGAVVQPREHDSQHQ